MPNRTALSPGQRAEFLKTGIGALTLLSHDPSFDSTTADGWAKNGEVMLREFGRVFIPPSPDLARGIVKTVIVVIGGGRTTDQIIEAARKQKGRNRPYINSDIKQANMLSGHGRRRSAVLEFFEFDHDPLTEEVRARCEEPGYGYPLYEDGLRFQEDHPDDQRERPHVFVPENPWCDADGNPRVLFLWVSAGNRELDLDDRDPGYGWDRSCLFARRKY